MQAIDLQQVTSSRNADPVSFLQDFEQDEYLPFDFQNHPQGAVNTPTEEGVGCYDVLCGRHKAAFNNVGNRRFRVTVSLALGRYIEARSRKDRSVVIASVASLVHSIGGRFLQRKKGAWVELSKKEAHNKTGHALRDMAASVSKHPGRAVVMAPPPAPAATKVSLAIAKHQQSNSPPKASGCVLTPRPLQKSSSPPSGIQQEAVSTLTSGRRNSLTMAPRQEPRPSFDVTMMDMSPEELRDLRESFAAEGSCVRDEEDQMLAWLTGESSKVVLHQV